VIHQRFQTWQKLGVFDTLLRRLAEYYAEHQGIGWEWQAVDSKSAPAPLAADTEGRNPTGRGKQGSKLHLLVDERGAPLVLHVTGANAHDKWSADALIVSIVVERPDLEEVEQHFCADKGYDYDEVYQAVEQAHYLTHIKHRRGRNEPTQIGLECGGVASLRYRSGTWTDTGTLSCLVHDCEWAKHATA
jgi:putative transposase